MIYSTKPARSEVIDLSIFLLKNDNGLIAIINEIRLPFIEKYPCYLKIYLTKAAAKKDSQSTLSQ